MSNSDGFMEGREWCSPKTTVMTRIGMTGGMKMANAHGEPAIMCRSSLLALGLGRRLLNT